METCDAAVVDDARTDLSYTEIDGSILEGGGQILRNAVALSCIYGKPIRVSRIRKGRKQPGLRQQHLQGIVLCSEIYNATTSGLSVGSTQIEFKPEFLSDRTFFEGDSLTAGSCCLLAQVSLPILVYADPSKEYTITLKGGTDAEFAPAADYLSVILLPVLAQFGIAAKSKLVRRGFYPKGGGILQLHIRPTPAGHPLDAITMLERGPLQRIFGTALVSGVLPLRVAQAMRDGAIKTLRESGLVNCQIQIDTIHESQDRANGNGSVIFLCAESANGFRLGSSAIGDRNKQPFDTGKEAAEALLNEIQHGGCVDAHCQDQIVIFAALARGTSRVKCGAITLHTETAMHVMRSLTGAQFRVAEDPQSAGSFLFEIDGVGFISRHSSVA